MKTALARRVIQFFLDVRRKREIGRQLRDFAEKYAGTEADLDRDLAEEGLLVWNATERQFDG